MSSITLGGAATGPINVPSEIDATLGGVGSPQYVNGNTLTFTSSSPEDILVGGPDSEMGTGNLTVHYVENGDGFICNLTITPVKTGTRAIVTTNNFGATNPPPFVFVATDATTQSVRTTPENVEDVIDFDPIITNLKPFILAANQLVNKVCAPTLAYTEDELTVIETWLAAHFVAVRDPRYSQEMMGAAQAQYQGQVTANLGATIYGQQAMLLDTQGGLAYLDKHVAAGKRAQVGIISLGSSCGRYPGRIIEPLID